MRRPTDLRCALLALAFSPLLMAQTQPPATAPVVTPDPASAAAAPPVTYPPGTVVAPLIPPAAAGIGAEAESLATLRGLTAKRQQQLTLDQTEADIEEVAARRGNSTGTRRDLPELVGIVGGGKNLIAEFLVGAALLEVQPGDWVTPDWRLAEIHRNGVSLRSRGGRKETLLFGQRSQAGALEGMRPAAFTPPQNRPQQ